MKKFFMTATLLLAAALGLCLACGEAPEAVLPVPTAQQVEWQRDEVWAFVHFGPNTFNDSEWGYGDTDPSVFNPAKLDCEQWARTFAAAGIKGVIITAKHHDGFCLWPSKYTDYTVAASPYKDGKGDIVGELAQACDKYGLKMGVYLSPWDRHQSFYGSQEYVEYYHNQLCELLTSYGTISEIWMDGANGGDGWYGGACERRSIDATKYYDYERVRREVEELQPGALIFSDGGPGCRWMGNERGQGGQTNWSFLRSGEVYPGYPNAAELTVGHEDGDAWIPAESDVSIRNGWFWHGDADVVKTPRQLADIYYSTVGRNCKLLVNFPPDRDGLIPASDSLAAVQARAIIESELGSDLLLGASVKASAARRGGAYGAGALTDGDPDTYWAAPDGVTTACLEIRPDCPVTMERLVVQEYIPLGQRVQAFSVEYFDGSEWLPLPVDEQTTTIGYKRILRFPAVTAEALRLNVIASRACPCISRVSAF